MSNNMMNVNIRMNKSTKESFESFCGNVGLTMTAAINLFVTKVVKEQRIPFEINNTNFNAETISAFKEAEDISNHPEKYKGYQNAQEMFDNILED